MLEIYKGQSSKSYENVFFRQIAAELSTLFATRGWDGLLIGMPECKTDARLQIDCLLITPQQMIIIDLKNYGGQLALPAAQHFTTGRWVLDGEQTVKGGSAPNPFAQLGKQRARFVRELMRKVKGFERSAVSTMVCFHKPVALNGEIPGQYELGFSIVDVTNYADKIVDIVDVLEDKRRQFLAEPFRQAVLQTVFSAPAYSLAAVIEDVEEEPVTEVEGLAYHAEIEAFLTSEKRVMVLTGPTKSGKTSLISAIRDQAFDCQFTDVPVFAYSNRIREKMLKSHPHLEEVESLFGTVFDFALETIDDNYQKHIPLRSRDEEEPEKTLYIIDDSQLITNSSLETEFLKFGSGQLLQDVFDYVQLHAHPEAKILFIGDKNKLSYGSPTENALNVGYLTRLLQQEGVQSDVATLQLPPNERYSDIVNVCNDIASSIEAGRFNRLHIEPTTQTVLCEQSKKRAALEQLVQHSKTSKFVVYTNEQAASINRWIKHNLLKNGEQLNVGDYVIFNAATLAYEPQPNEMSEPIRISNGAFAEVVAVNDRAPLIFTEKVKERSVTLTFVRCQLRLTTGQLVDMYVFANYLQALGNELTHDEVAAYQMLLTRFAKELLQEEPFEQSVEFAQMMASGDYVRLVDDGRVSYRMPNDRRKLTAYEKAYRQRVLKKCKRPDSKYFQLFQAARTKYGWAMTVNKAMAYSFDTVYFNVDKGENYGKTNADYFKWLYTGIASATHAVHLINWEPITPFMKTEFTMQEPLPFQAKQSALFQLTNVEQAAQELTQFLQQRLANVATVRVTKSSSYQEQVSVQLGEESLELFFSYNGKGEVKQPRLKSGKPEHFQLVSNLLAMKEDRLAQVGSFKPYLQELAQIAASQQIDIAVHDFHEWDAQLYFSKQQAELMVQVYFNGQHFMTRFSYINGEPSLFEELKQLIEMHDGCAKQLVTT